MSTSRNPTQDSFCNACGATGPATLRVEGPEVGDVQERLLEQPFAVLGRDPRADVHMDEGGVSRRHAYVQMIDGHWFCVDLLSKQGTQWDDGPRRAGWLDADGVQVGPFRLSAPEAVGEIPAWDPLQDRVPDSPALPGVSLEFLNGDVRQSAWRMSRVLALVGQAPECKVRLVAPSVSKFHCALVRTRAGAWAVDLLGRQGMRVNGEPARLALLREGDLLQVGDFVIRLRYYAAQRPQAADGGPRNGTDAAQSAAGSPLVVAESPPRYFLPGERGPVDAEVVERLMVPLVNEFRLMQQQMFDQFQQAMNSMFNMFTTMHREQTDLIHEELDRLHKLTQELHALQAELAKQPPRPAAVVPQAAPTPPRPAPRPTYTPPRPAPASPVAPAEGNGPAVTAPPPAAAADEEGAEIHAWLTQRLANLQRERQSSWQRLMNFMMGKKS